MRRKFRPFDFCDVNFLLSLRSWNFTRPALVGGEILWAHGARVLVGAVHVNDNVTDNGTLAFNRSDALAYAGVISGTGGLTKLAANNLILTGVSTYGGATQVSAGTLSIGNGFTALVNVFIDILYSVLDPRLRHARVIA